MILLFLRQFWALTWKNWIVLSRNPISNFLRCFLLPAGFGVFLGLIPDLISRAQQMPKLVGLVDGLVGPEEDKIRISYLMGVEAFAVFMFFLSFSGIGYHLPGAVCSERNNQLAAHMKAMGVLDSARALSWHFSLSCAYLPAWIITSVVWQNRLFPLTPLSTLVFVHVLLGCVLASWSYFIASPFNTRSQTAGVTTTFLSSFSILYVLAFREGMKDEPLAIFYSIISPPSFYVYVLKEICRVELREGDPTLPYDFYETTIRIPAILTIAMVNVFIWPAIGILLEKVFYDPSFKLFSRSRKAALAEEFRPLSVSSDVAISMKSLNKTFKTSGQEEVVALSDLTLEVPKSGIFVLLGANGTGKSTILSILGGLISPTTGSIHFSDSDGASRPPRGTLGIVPQKNIFFDDLTCLQNLRVWSAIKWDGQWKAKSKEKGRSEKEYLVQLLKDCDLGEKIHAKAKTLSGGQKRKLQLAIGLAEGSKIILVDECTTGVDPMSRRALWRTLTSQRDRTIIFTTHFLDEVDYLADHIAILAAPGKLLADDTPVSLKRRFGQGYSVIATLKHPFVDTTDLSEHVKRKVHDAEISRAAPNQVSYRIMSGKLKDVEKVLHVLDDRGEKNGVLSYDIRAPSIEDVFLELVKKNDRVEAAQGINRLTSISISGSRININSASDLTYHEPATPYPDLQLSDGKRASPLSQAATIFYKRSLIIRRRPLTAVLAVATVVAGAAYVPLNLIAPSKASRLEWIMLFPATMTIFPAFFASYVAKERQSGVRAMQLSNGLSNPLGLWLGHLAFDSMFSFISVTLIIFFMCQDGGFHHLGAFYAVLFLYGVSSTALSYLVSLFCQSPLSAFIAVQYYQSIMLFAYSVARIVILIMVSTPQKLQLAFNILHVVISLFSPLPIATWISWLTVRANDSVSFNEFKWTVILAIAYFILYPIILIPVIVRIDSGAVLMPRLRSKWRSPRLLLPSFPPNQDVIEEAEAVSRPDNNDIVKMLRVTKSFGDNKVLDDVSLGVTENTVLGLLGPNGGGKTTSFNIIRSDLKSNDGDVFIRNNSVAENPKTTRASLGVCPQFTAIDDQLTVREHLIIYGRLKGLTSAEIVKDVDTLLVVTQLHQYAHRLASTLSGGNQRKLALAIAFIGNPPVLLIDEFSSGIDAKMKRELWDVLKKVMPGKAVILATHSMEEASYLANKVAIIAKRLLAVGTTSALYDRYSVYEVHFSCKTKEDITKARRLMSHIPGARKADDVATRFEVPLEKDGGPSLLELFRILSKHGEGEEGEMLKEFTVEKATLERVYLNVIRENQVIEQDAV